MKVQDLNTGDLIEWRGQDRLVIEHVNLLATGDVEIMGEFIDKSGYAVGTYAYDTEIVVLD